MNRHLDNLSRMEWARHVASRCHDTPLLGVTLTVRQAIPRSWLKQLDRLSKVPRIKRRAKLFFVRESRRLRHGPLIGWRDCREQELKHLINTIHNKLGGDYRIGRRKLKRAFSWEGDGTVERHHVHGFIEIPPGYSAEKFRALVDRCWQLSVWWRPRNEFEKVESPVDLAFYMTKRGFDSLDCSTLHI